MCYMRTCTFNTSINPSIDAWLKVLGCSKKWSESDKTNTCIHRSIHLSDSDHLPSTPGTCTHLPVANGGNKNKKWTLGDLNYSTKKRGEISTVWLRDLVSNTEWNRHYTKNTVVESTSLLLNGGKYITMSLVDRLKWISKSYTCDTKV
jgi:hypothetical protein